MILINIQDETLKNLNEQTIERTAERLSYNSNDILKIAVHDNIYKSGYKSETKLALVHILISCATLIKQLNYSETELNELIKECINENKGIW